MYWDTREPQLGLAGEGVRGVLNPFLGWPFKTFIRALHVYLGVSFVIYAPPTFFFSSLQLIVSYRKNSIINRHLTKDKRWPHPFKKPAGESKCTNI